jgi:hypothetical protein
VVDHDPKFWAKKPVMNDSGRKIVAMVVSCFITSFWRVLTMERYRHREEAVGERVKHARE